MMAVAAEVEYCDVVQTLLEHGADVNIQNKVSIFSTKLQLYSHMYLYCYTGGQYCSNIRCSELLHFSLTDTTRAWRQSQYTEQSKYIQH